MFSSGPISGILLQADFQEVVKVLSPGFFRRQRGRRAIWNHEDRLESNEAVGKQDGTSASAHVSPAIHVPS